MVQFIDERAPLPALRRGVLGFLAGTALGAVFVGGVFAFDVGSLSLLWSKSGGVPLGDLVLLPVTFGLVGLVAGPALGEAIGDDPGA